MKYYSVAMANVTEDSWTQEYTEKVTQLVESFGGKYIVRTSNVEVIEGGVEAPQVLVVIEFPSKDVFEEFYHSEAYKPYLEARKAGATGQFYLVPVNDDAQ